MNYAGGIALAQAVPEEHRVGSQGRWHLDAAGVYPFKGVALHHGGVRAAAQGVTLGARRIAHLGLRHRVQNGPDHQAEAKTPQHRQRDADQPERPRTNSTNVPTGTPVGPAGMVTRSLSLYAVPAMSRCTHG